MSKKWILCVVLISFGMALGPVVPTLKVSGVGQVTFQPDYATITLGVDDLYPDVTVGQKIVNQKMGRFTMALTEMIATHNIETSLISIGQQYNYVNRKKELSGYAIKQFVTVTIQDLSKIGDVVDLGVASGLNTIKGIHFDHSERTLYQKQALTIGLLEAEKKAKQMAKVLGLKRLKVMHIAEGGMTSPPQLREQSLARVKSDFSANTSVFNERLTVIKQVNLEYTYQ